MQNIISRNHLGESFDGNCDQSQWKDTSMIVHESTSLDQYSHCNDYITLKGPLSIKYNLEGKEDYILEYQSVTLSNSFVLINNDQSYQYVVKNKKPIESICLFLDQNFVNQIVASFLHDQHLLDDPSISQHANLEFSNRIYHQDNVLTPLFQLIRQAMRCQSEEWGYYEEYLYFVGKRLLEIHSKEIMQLESVPAKRKSTRLEIYRRLHLAKDYIDENFHTDICLKSISRHAGLSKYHFLRLFKKQFHITPYQHITCRRLSRARDLLRHTEKSIKEVCFDVGFHDISSFTKKFLKSTGKTPGTYRNE